MAVNQELCVIFAMNEYVNISFLMLTSIIYHYHTPDKVTEPESLDMQLPCRFHVFSLYRAEILVQPTALFNLCSLWVNFRWCKVASEYLSDS